MARSKPLRYVGDDKKHAATLENGIQWFEPIDAKEVLESGNEDYEELDDEELQEAADSDETEAEAKPAAKKVARKRR